MGSDMNRALSSMKGAILLLVDKLQISAAQRCLRNNRTLGGKPAIREDKIVLLDTQIITNSLGDLDERGSNVSKKQKPISKPLSLIDDLG